MRIDGGIVWVDVWMYGCMDVWMYVWMYGCMDVWMCGCMDVWMYGCVLYHPPSILTLTHSLRSFVASPVKSYGVNARVIFVGGFTPPYWFIERSYRRRGAEPPVFASSNCSVLYIERAIIQHINPKIVYHNA